MVKTGRKHEPIETNLAGARKENSTLGKFLKQILSGQRLCILLCIGLVFQTGMVIVPSMAASLPHKNISQSAVKSPAWHAGELKQTEKLVKSGQAKFSDWEKAKVRIRKAAKLL